MYHLSVVNLEAKFGCLPIPQLVTTTAEPLTPQDWDLTHAVVHPHSFNIVVSSPEHIYQRYNI